MKFYCYFYYFFSNEKIDMISRKNFYKYKKCFLIIYYIFNSLSLDINIYKKLMI